MPFHQIRPQQIVDNSGGFEDSIGNIPMNQGHVWVPRDDESTIVWNWMVSVNGEPLTDEHRLEPGNGNGPDHVDQATSRSFDGKWNEYGIDRARQRALNFSGILGVNKQDRAVQESMGRVVDRSREQLGPSDRAVITMRQMLLDAIRTVREGGDPPAADESYYRLRAWEKVMPRVEDWRAEFLPEMEPAGLGREGTGVG